MIAFLMHSSVLESTKRFRSVPTRTILLGLLWFGALDVSSASSGEPVRAQPDAATSAEARPTIKERPSVDELIAKLQAKYKQNDKKYDTLADEIDKEVRKAIKSTVWLSDQQAATSRMFSEHPYFVLVDQLAKVAQADASKVDAKRKALREALLAKYPWLPRLELDLGLEHGSDRPVPTNENGFIALGSMPLPAPSFPELLTNQYLFGLQEIVGWRAGVKLGKTASFEGRDPKKPLVIEKTLPGWERLRVFLQGSLPEVPLFAMPALKHAIHARLAERRRSPKGEPARMDEELAFFDSKWNGFTFDVPFSKERLAVVVPVHVLMGDRKGFFNRFADSEHMAQVGDLPFIAVQTYEHYAKVILGERIDIDDFIANSGAATAAAAKFQASTVYLSRYKALIDELVRAVLTPTLAYPQSLSFADYPTGNFPTERASAPEFDVTRKHVLLAWAYAGKDPVKFADFLNDELLDKEANRFPNNIELSAAFTVRVREKQKEMLQAIAAHIADERSHVPTGGKAWPSDFEREFSPYAAYLELEGDPASGNLLASFHALNASATKLIEDVAYGIVQREIGK